MPRPTPLFEKYTVTGRTYTTRSGAVIPNELQYYDGEMAHLYGECANVAAVNEALAGSGYRAVILEHADGRRTAVAQIWLSRFADSTIGPYNALFIVVVAARDEEPAARTTIRADRNGASSALPMLDGHLDAGSSVYENRPRLFLVRLLDTTQVAIDVGRERMGTDKRPGTIDLSREGRYLRVSISDQRRNAVVRGRLELPPDEKAYMPTLARAAATADMPLQSLPEGTEYVYPAAARIGRGPVVHWEWRSDAAPRLHPIEANTVAFDARSEEGQLLVSWGFTPKVLAYFPKVRGVITGLAEASQPASSDIRSGRVTLSPASHTVEHHPLRQPQWDWEAKYFGSLTAHLRKEVVGATPDGLRINWHVNEGTFVGPGFDAVVLPGAADWMRIRRDGVAIVSVQACFETRTGARVYGSYGGIFDLGREGYARALRDEYDALPPVVVTPTYATADPRLEWLNRAQCIGVGRVDMAALRVEFDVYLTHVGERARSASTEVRSVVRPVVPRATPQRASLYTRVGGYDVVAAVSDDFLVLAWADTQLGRFFAHGHSQSTKRVLRQHVVDLLCELMGGPSFYVGRDMKTVHKGLQISASDWTIAIDLFAAALEKNRVPAQEQREFLQIIHDMRHLVVEGS